MLDNKTKIVCTLGPSSNSVEMIEKLASAGMNICRFNFSHETQENHEILMSRVREVSERTGYNLAIMLDTKGPEIRTGLFENGGEEFKTGDVVKLSKKEMMGNHECFHIQCPELFADVTKDDRILIDDGKMNLTVLENDGEYITCRIENNGWIKNRKGCNVPGVKLSMPFISEKDESDIRFGCRHNIDFIAASFVRRPEDVLAIRSIIEEEGKPDIQIIVKIENQEGFDNLAEILKVADGCMVARGDLGVEVKTQSVPFYQKKIVSMCNSMGKPVIVATHMLETMTHNPRPTRAEANDVFNAVLDGADAVMLSGESAAGEYPFESVTTMATIAKAAEDMIDYRDRLSKTISFSKRNMEDAIGISAAEMALTMEKVKAIVAFTQKGLTAKSMSKFRPSVPVIAVTFSKEVQRQLNICWGVTSVYSDIQNNPDNQDDLARIIAKGYGCKKGDMIILTMGYPVGSGSTNTIKIVEV